MDASKSPLTGLHVTVGPQVTSLLSVLHSWSHSITYSSTAWQRKFKEGGNRAAHVLLQLLLHPHTAWQAHPPLAMARGAAPPLAPSFAMLDPMIMHVQESCSGAALWSLGWPGATGNASLSPMTAVRRALHCHSECQRQNLGGRMQPYRVLSTRDTSRML